MVKIWKANKALLCGVFDLLAICLRELLSRPTRRKHTHTRSHYDLVGAKLLPRYLWKCKSTTNMLKFSIAENHIVCDRSLKNGRKEIHYKTICIWKLQASERDGLLQRLGICMKIYIYINIYVSLHMYS